MIFYKKYNFLPKFFLFFYLLILDYLSSTFSPSFGFIFKLETSSFHQNSSFCYKIPQVSANKDLRKFNFITQGYHWPCFCTRYQIKSKVTKREMTLESDGWILAPSSLFWALSSWEWVFLWDTDVRRPKSASFLESCILNSFHPGHF